MKRGSFINSSYLIGIVAAICVCLAGYLAYQHLGKSSIETQEKQKPIPTVKYVSCIADMQAYIIANGAKRTLGRPGSNVRFWPKADIPDFGSN